MKKALIKECQHCGRVYGPDNYKKVYDFNLSKFCSKECYHLWARGENHGNWKNGTKTRPDGYIRDSQTDRYIHRTIMEEFLGRPLKSDEQIHHIDGNPSNNHISNLQLYDSNSSHRIYEASIAERGKDGRFI